MSVAGRNAVSSGGQAGRLRAAIDAGHTGDKVAFPDPAAAPLGTDDEAAGVTPSRSALAADVARETDRPVKTGESGAPTFIMIGTVLLSGLALAGAFLLR